MKYLLSILAILALSACSSTSSNMLKFPEAPISVLEKCPSLNKIKDDARLSDLTKSVTTNYTSYHECSAKTDAWIEWYYSQKKLFESLN